VHKELLAQSPLLALPIAALLIFVAVFAVVCVRTMRKKALAYAPIANLPLAPEEESHERA
jgi:hypothetical protein